MAFLLLSPTLIIFLHLTDACHLKLFQVISLAERNAQGRLKNMNSSEMAALCSLKTSTIESSCLRLDVEIKAFLLK